MEFAGERIVVTGATKGIGRATAQLLAERGAKVVAIGRSKDDLASLAAEIDAETHSVDLADPEAVRAVAKAIQPIDRLVNNAGTTSLEPFLETSVGAIQELMAVNVIAAMIFGQETAKSMIARGKKGAIVNVSSISSSLGFADHAAYCASKGALDSLTTVMANELGRQGIRVNAVCPTIVLTPMAVKAWSDPAKADPMLKRIPLGRFFEPIECAETIAFLLSDKASMVNGVTMPVDGGFLIN
ncbi:short-chain dehydrogenase [Labrys miyagiensis]|uniref:Short-chain dehydrogenase n=1 Tax=Labrys miyagiensis TaxID=346912 RepID=A0ABQ6CLP2_9HYPH|nr:SDR family oxidoreductase [Labrys miyagiensis]GLS21243.1 short-chain dehydrogenase [Labrys miyagiensis]